MKWEDIYNEEWKIRHIMEDVLGWEWHASWESYLKKYGAQEHALGAGQSYSTPTPVAFYVSYAHEWRVFSTDHDADHEELKVFNPLRELTDAWLVAETVTQHHSELNLQELFTLLPEQICQIAWETVQASTS